MLVEAPPRVAFLGVGWIGRARMQAAVQAGALSVGGVADADAGVAADAAGTVGGAHVYAELDELLEDEIDAVVIATPTAVHAEQTSRVLERGLPVFCQKPLARSETECRALIDLARERDLRLGVDMSYRHLQAVARIDAALAAGAIGAPHALELTFHNAYGPDKAWARDISLAGGGALIDLGCHLLDLARRWLGPLEVRARQVDLYARGRRLEADPDEVEDLALAQLSLGGGASVRLACSWNHPAGRDAIIQATLTGSDGALQLANVGGSFYDFEAVLLRGAQAERLAGPPDEWGGRAICEWAQALGAGAGFDPEVERLAEVAAVIDGIYGRGSCGR